MDEGGTTIIIGFCLAYLLFVLVVGLLSGRGVSRSVTGFVAGDRKMSGLLLYFVISAAIYSSFAFLGAPGWAYSRGGAAFYVLCFSCLGAIPLYFLGPRARRWGERHGFVTQAEMMGWRFKSRTLQGLLAVIGVAVMIPYLTLQMKGAGLILSTLSDGAIPFWLGATLVYGVVVTYVWVSGVMGVGWTNALQGILMLATAWFLGLYIPWTLYGGIGAMFRDLVASGQGSMLTAPGLTAAGKPWNWWEFSSWILVSAAGFSCWPHIFMKSFAAPSDRQMRLTILLYPTFQILMVPLLLLGFAAILAYPGITPADSIVPFLLTHTGLPVGVVGVAAIGVLAASMSTGDTLLHASASSIIRDGLGAMGMSPRSDQTERWLMRMAVLAVAVLAYWFAMDSRISLVALLAATYGAVAQLMPPLLAAFYWRRANGTAVTAGLLAGLATNVLLLQNPDWRPAPLHEGIYGLAVNAAVLVGLTLLRPGPRLENADGGITTE